MSSPERPGMLTSSRMQAGVRARAAARNDWPSAKQVTRQPSGANTADERVAHRLVVVDDEDFGAVQLLLLRHSLRSAIRANTHDQGACIAGKLQVTPDAFRYRAVASAKPNFSAAASGTAPCAAQRRMRAGSHARNFLRSNPR